MEDFGIKFIKASLAVYGLYDVPAEASWEVNSRIFSAMREATAEKQCAAVRILSTLKGREDCPEDVRKAASQLFGDVNSLEDVFNRAEYFVLGLQHLEPVCLLLNQAGATFIIKKWLEDIEALRKNYEYTQSEEISKLINDDLEAIYRAAIDMINVLNYETFALVDYFYDMLEAYDNHQAKSE